MDKALPLHLATLGDIRDELEVRGQSDNLQFIFLCTGTRQRVDVCWRGTAEFLEEASVRLIVSIKERI